MIAVKYKCLKCSHAWTEPRPDHKYCPQCNHPYVSWTNYEAWLKAPGKTPRFLKAHYG